MKRLTLVFVLALILILLGTGCKADPSAPPDEPLQSTPAVKPPGGTTDQTETVPQEDEDPYPGPVADEPPEVEPEDVVEAPVADAPYPEPEDVPPAVSLPYVITTEHDYAPAEDDAGLDQGNVFIKSSDIFILESFPMQVRLQLLGDLPTPCHELRAVVSPPDNDGNIEIEAYSLSDPEIMCTQVLDPFEVIIPIGDFTSGSYILLVNGEQVGNLDFP